MPKDVAEVFELAGIFAEKGYSAIRGEAEERLFKEVIDEGHVALNSICRVTLERGDLKIKSAEFGVIYLDDSLEMNFKIYRERAAITEISDFEQHILGYFRQVV